jgi:hypothetical protein
MENLNFLQKQIELAQSSQSSIARICSLGAEIAKFYSSIASIFPHFFNILLNAYIQELFFNRAISRIALSRFNLFFPRNLWTQRETQWEEENVEPENAMPYIPFLLNSTLARILTSTLPEPLFKQAPKPIRSQKAAQQATLGIEKAPIEKPLGVLSGKTPINLIVQLQSELANKFTPSLESISSARLQYQEQTFSEPILSQTSTPRPEIGSKKGSVEKLLEERAEKIPINHAAVWQTQLASKVCPSVQNMLSALVNYQRLVFSSALLAATPMSSLLSLAGPDTAPSRVPSALFATPIEEKATQESSVTEIPALWDKTREIQATAEFTAKALEVAAAMQTAVGIAVMAHSMTLIPQTEGAQLTKARVRVVSPREPDVSPLKSQPIEFKIREEPSSVSFSKELTKEEESPPGLSNRLGLNSETLEALNKSTELPSLIFENQMPFLKIAETLSRISTGPAMPSLPMNELAYDRPAPLSSMPAPMPPTQISWLLHEIAPSLTSWIYEGSEVLRSTGVPLSAVPIAASEAEKVVSETLNEPTSSSGAAQPPIESKLSAVPNRASRLPTLIALAGAGSLISQRLSNELTALKKEAQIEKAATMMRSVQNTQEMTTVEESTETWIVAPSGRFVIAPGNAALPGEPVIAPSAVPMRSQSLWDKIRAAQAIAKTPLFDLEATQPAVIHARVSSPRRSRAKSIEAYPIEPSVRKSPPVSPSATRTSHEIPAIDVTESDEAAEEDLRGLERKISRILSEQLSRYYGSSRM